MRKDIIFQEVDPDTILARTPDGVVSWAQSGLDAYLQKLRRTRFATWVNDMTDFSKAVKFVKRCSPAPHILQTVSEDGESGAFVCGAAVVARGLYD